MQKIFSPQNKLTKTPRPLFLDAIPAGFPSPAEDIIDQSLDLNTYLIKHNSATFFLKVEGDSMKNAGIHSGDILIVDRALTHHINKIVVAIVDGEFTVKRYIKKGNQAYLYPENSNYSPLRITDLMDFTIWGVVTYVIHQTK